MVSKKFNIPVSAFSSVMGMEISSIAFHFHRLAIISRILEYLGLIVYVFLVLYFVFMLVYHKKILKNKTMVPASFTFAAGSSVLGSILYMVFIMDFISVVFPEPFAPSTPTISWSSTCIFIFFKIPVYFLSL